MMTENECKQVYDISQRIKDVVNFLNENEASNLSNEDLDSLAMLLTNISGVLEELSGKSTE